MPRLNNIGNVAMGIGGVPGSIDGTIIPNAYGPHWFTDNTIIYPQVTPNVLIALDSLGNKSTVAPRGANDLLAKGGVWAAWLDGFGLFTSTGLHEPTWGLLDVGPDGAIAHNIRGHDIFGVDVTEKDGSTWTLIPGPQTLNDLCLLGKGRAIWRDHSFNIVTFNLPACTKVPGPFWLPKAVWIEDEWWVCYFSALYGLVFHPFRTTIGYVIVPPTMPSFRPDIVALGRSIARIAWSLTDGEGPSDYRLADINVLVDKRVEIVRMDSIVEIGKPCWLGWFEFIEPVAPLAPHNCILRIRSEPGTIRDKNLNYFAQWVQGSLVNEIEETCLATSLPCTAYWDARFWPRWPQIKSTDWLGLQAYCLKTESPAQFEAHMRTIIESVPSSYNNIVLICQCYTSNADHTTDLIGLVPVYSRLARDYRRVTMLLVFSDQGRGTGLNDHPEVRPYWQTLYDGIKEIDMGDNGIVDGVLLNPEAYFFSLVEGKDPNDYANVLQSIRPQLEPFGIGQQAGSGCDLRGGLYMPTADCPNAAPLPGEECLAVRQDPKCHEGGGGLKVYVVQDQPKAWIWAPQGDMSRYVPVRKAEQPPTGNVGVAIYEHNLEVRRSDVTGLLIKFEIYSTNPVTQIELDLVEDGEPSIIINFPAELKRDGRYVRALAFKPTGSINSNQPSQQGGTI